jgi:3-dehydroquinate synthetase
LSVTATTPALTRTEVRIGADRVPYVSGFGCPAALAGWLNDQLAGHSSVLLLVDSNVRGHATELAGHLAGGPDVVMLVVETRERDKTLTVVQGLLEAAVAARVDRASVVVAMGGGLLGNLAGMVAALLYRGLPLVHLPTTPVAAFDSVLSAKQAVNLGSGKNLCGLYRTPALIGCDLNWLRTVPHRQLLTGYAEMAKNVLAVAPGDAGRFVDAIERHGTDLGATLTALLDLGIRAKAPFLAADAHEKRRALVFEYGHTVGHALEFASAGTLSHGAAISWGMLAAADVSAALCGLPGTAVEQHHRLLATLPLDRGALAAVEPAAVKRLLDNDNKRGYLRTSEDFIPMVLLDQLGAPVLHEDRPLVAAPRELVHRSVDRLFAVAAEGKDRT